MTALDRKLLRDFLNLRMQIFAIVLVIASGVATFVMSLCMILSLERTLSEYYERNYFAEIFAHLKRAPNSLAQRIAEIPGVRDVQARIVEQAILEVPGFTEPVVGRFISTNDFSMLNKRYVSEGRSPRPSQDIEVLVNEGFAKAHQFHSGDAVYAVMNGRKILMRIVGIALSPEYVYQINEGELLPDESRFGVFWMRYEDLAPLFQMDGAFNDVVLSLNSASLKQEVLLQLDQILQQFGSLGAYAREDQPSHKFVTNEMKELRGMALVIPSIFLSVAAFILNIVISRLVSTQREQIATIKAFGYTNVELAIHYLKLVLLIVGLGNILGILVGAKLGQGLTGMYARFFHFPTFSFYLSPYVVFLAIAVSSFAAIAGTIIALTHAVFLPPAQAMRPEAPVRYKKTFLERLGLSRLIQPAGRMVLRKLERKPLRAFFSVIGIAFSVAIVILGNFSVDAIDYVLESEFVFAQRYDVGVSFLEASSGKVLSELEGMPGVTNVEPYRQIPVRLSNHNHARRLGVMGINPDGKLYRVMDVHRLQADLPEGGLLLSKKLAKVLGVRAGQWVWMEVLEGKRQICRMYVSGTLDDFSGLAAYMRIDSLHALLQEENSISGAYLSVDSQEKDQLYYRLKNSPQITSVTIKEAVVQSFKQTIAENLLRMRLFNIMFACIIAVGVVYNTARVSLSEQAREFATLRVIGFTRNEIFSILGTELAFLTLVGIPIGLVLGRMLAFFLIMTTFDTELFRIPLIIERSTYGFAAVVTCCATILSAFLMRKMLDRLDLVGVLKSCE